MTKTIFLLNIDDFAPEVTQITYPLIRLYADRIGAKIHMITERKFPEWPVTYEKMQISELAQKIGSDWNIYIDSDALIHPECPDFTIYLPKGTVSFHAADCSSVRFRVDNVFLRDGRYLAPGNWFTIASDLCVDLWRPLDMTPDEAVRNIYPTVNEKNNGITAEHLIDDYTLARNMSMFGLRFKSFLEICKEQGFGEYLAHQYTMTIDEKTVYLRSVLNQWNAEKIHSGDGSIVKVS